MRLIASKKAGHAELSLYVAVVDLYKQLSRRWSTPTAIPVWERLAQSIGSESSKRSSAFLSVVVEEIGGDPMGDAER